MNIVEIVTYCADVTPLEQLADAVVNERLAAAAHTQGPVRSVYRWQGSVFTETEWQLDILTTRAQADNVIARIRALHPYDTPATVIREIAADARFARWVLEQTS